MALVTREVSALQSNLFHCLLLNNVRRQFSLSSVQDIISVVVYLLVFRYENSDWGWNDKQKKEEMTEDKAWYIVARDTEGQPVALVHFRFDVDEDIEVLYW